MRWIAWHTECTSTIHGYRKLNDISKTTLSKLMNKTLRYSNYSDSWFNYPWSWYNLFKWLRSDNEKVKKDPYFPILINTQVQELEITVNNGLSPPSACPWTWNMIKGSRDTRIWERTRCSDILHGYDNAYLIKQIGFKILFKRQRTMMIYDELFVFIYLYEFTQVENQVLYYPLLNITKNI